MARNAPERRPGPPNRLLVLIRAVLIPLDRPQQPISGIQRAFLIHANRNGRKAVPHVSLISRLVSAMAVAAFSALYATILGFWACLTAALFVCVLFSVICAGCMIFNLI
jgi:hypothetical protein